MSTKQRITLALSPDNPLQRNALAVLAQAAPGTRTTLICQALCEYRKNEILEDKLRRIIQEELQNVNINPALQSARTAERGKADSKALDFIRSLQGD